MATMENFKRSPSKVWWGNEDQSWRSSSSSPGSQDSGFSDSILHKNDNLAVKPSEKLINDIYKEISTNSSNFKEKLTPSKTNSSLKTVKKEYFLNREKCLSEPVRKNRYIKKSPKAIRRTLFESANKYAENVLLDEQSEEFLSESSITSVKSLPNPSRNIIENFDDLSKTAPAILQNRFDCSFNSEDEGVTAFYSDSDDELKELFNGDLESPKHTSTPKNWGMERGPLRKKLPLNLYLKYQQERLPEFSLKTDNASVLTWSKEIRKNFEAECMTTLQSKSITAELNEKIDHLANSITSDIRTIIAHSASIETEYQNLNREQHHICALCQSLAGNIMNFFKTYQKITHRSTTKLYDEIKASPPEKALQLVSTLFDKWQQIRRDVYFEHVKNLVSKVEDPISELSLRATVTGIIFIASRNEQIAEIFIENDLIPILLILCEKCEGSTVRCLLLRALATLCCTAQAVRHFEKYSGIQVITDILEEDARPEPERSEAATVLAQVTAPWIEDNNNIRGLQDHSKNLVKALTKFIKTTRCCQNLLLCAAALSNISSLDTLSIKYIIYQDSIRNLLDSVNRKSHGNVYLLEQIACLIANTSAQEISRSYLSEVGASKALIYFLKNNYGEEFEHVERRLQQKAIIALSRLSSHQEAAKQIVESGGVELLVKLCRGKEDRFNSDAVLVAALATLRRIAESCGKEVLSCQDSQELVEPKLLDSFLAYSNQNESYV